MRRYMSGAVCWWPPPSALVQLCPMHKPLLASAGLSMLGRGTPGELPSEGARLPQAVW
ncbi:MAG: hypothetical protein KH354_02805 [Clostridiales bacterium]|nr:hypothetical protein [Clostridiales bacterium]